MAGGGAIIAERSGGHAETGDRTLPPIRPRVGATVGVARPREQSAVRSIMRAELRPDEPGAAECVGKALRAMLAAGALDLPSPGSGGTPRRWAALAGWGRRDLAMARLAEGHTDAIAILDEAGRAATPGALYGVWAARSGGAEARLVRSGDAVVLRGTVRFCSGARVVDRALVVADDAGAADGARPLLVDLAVTQPRVGADPDTWASAAMAATDTLDVRFDDVPVPAGAVVGGPGWYTGRAGFAVGGAGVAAVWWGGAAGVLDRVVGHLPLEPDAHQLAHVGELHALLEAADALLARVAAAIDAASAAAPAGVPAAQAAAPAARAAAPAGAASDHARQVAEVRSASERVVREVVDRAPRIVGPTPLSRDGDLARALADLALYVRQHHGERDHAALGAQVLASRTGQ